MLSVCVSFLRFVSSKKTLLFSAAISFFVGAGQQQAGAAAFSLGNLVVVRVGDGSAALSSASTAASLLEFSTLGSLIQTINLPTAASGANQALTLSGSATSEGFLKLSVDGQYLTMGGYGAAPGTAGVVTATPGTVNRVIGRIDLSGNINTTTALNDAYNGSNIRSAVSSDGINLWSGGNGGSGLGASAATRYTTLGSSTSTQLHSTTTNIRVVDIFNGQLYATSGSGGFTGVGTVGTGLSTTSGQTFTLLPGFPTTGTHSPYDFFFKDSNTIYVADDGGVATGGGIQKWALSGGTWSLVYTLLNNGTTTTAVRGLAGAIDGNGDAVLFGTTGTQLITVTDTGAGATATVLATAAANTAFRGVEFLPAPIPEPGTLALTGLGLAALLAFRRSRIAKSR